MLAAPLRRDGRPIGTLSLYDRVSGERFYPEAFDDDDARRADQVAVGVNAFDDHSLVYGERLTSKPIDKVVSTGRQDQSFELIIQ